MTTQEKDDDERGRVGFDSFRELWSGPGGSSCDLRHRSSSSNTAGMWIISLRSSNNTLPFCIRNIIFSFLLRRRPGCTLF